MNKITIIAEAGVNHNGSINKAKEMICAASEAGADVIKFQTFKAVNLVKQDAPMADYQKKNTKSSESQYEMLKKLELGRDSHYLLKEYCDKKNILFNSTPFDKESIDFLYELGVDFWKIPSGEIMNVPFLRYIGKYPKPVILSTGMSNLGEVEFAISTLTEAGIHKDEITILHCNTDYPTKYGDVNLLAMNTLRAAFKIKVGYSDHTLGIEVPIAAAALQASVIEKHFTLDRSLPGPDHLASLNPIELKIMISSIRNIEKALGTGIKNISESEKKNVNIARKSIVAARDISVGELFSEENLTTKRPGDGIPSFKWDEVIGKKAKKAYLADESILE